MSEQLELMPKLTIEAVCEILRLLTGTDWQPHGEDVSGKWYPVDDVNDHRRARVTVWEPSGEFKVLVYED